MSSERHDVLIVGSGGREAALGWKLRQSPWVRNIYFAAPKNNAGTAIWGENLGIDIGNPQELSRNIRDIIEFTISKNIGLTVVGPEAPLFARITDQYLDRDLPINGLCIFGPTSAAAEIERSKAFGVRFFEKYHIPHPPSKVFSQDQVREAHQLVDRVPRSGVIKADGPALGKGVFLPESRAEAHELIERLLVQEELGEAGTTIVIQERLYGSELSVMAITDGQRYQLLPTAQDYKRSFDGNKGPNTGGMGAYSPVSLATPELLTQIEKEILTPTLKGLTKEGRPFTGALYAGLMISGGKPYVLEFNARFGDPETQIVLPLVESDLFPVLHQAAQGNLSDQNLIFRPGYSVCVVLASQGYPEKYSTNFEIYNSDCIPDQPNLQVFLSAVKKDQFGKLLTSGGRVMGITTQGETLAEARDRSYSVIGTHSMGFGNYQYRHDIALL